MRIILNRYRVTLRSNHVQSNVSAQLPSFSPTNCAAFHQIMPVSDKISTEPPIKSDCKKFNTTETYRKYKTVRNCLELSRIIGLKAAHNFKSIQSERCAVSKVYTHYKYQLRRKFLVTNCAAIHQIVPVSDKITTQPPNKSGWSEARKEENSPQRRGRARWAWWAAPASRGTPGAAGAGDWAACRARESGWAAAGTAGSPPPRSSGRGCRGRAGRGCRPTRTCPPRSPDWGTNCPRTPATTGTKS